VVTLAQLPVGPSVGAAAAVLILGSDGVATAAAAGVLMTVTGTVGGLCFAAWAGADKLWSVSRWGAVRRRALARAARKPEVGPHAGAPTTSSLSLPGFRALPPPRTRPRRDTWRSRADGCARRRGRSRRPAPIEVERPRVRNAQALGMSG
jgi:hypothetical protein